MALLGPAMLPAAAATRAVVLLAGAITLAPQHVPAAGSLVAVGPVEVLGRARTVPAA